MNFCIIFCLFQDYKNHFRSPKHFDATKTLKIRLGKRILAIRSAQRKKENEKMAGMSQSDKVEVRKESLFCKLCKLIFNCSREDHEASEFHKRIEEIVHPVCKICDKKFPAPLAQAKHLTKITHLKKVMDPESSNADDANDDEEEKDETVDPEDLGEFVTLDEVGEDDDDEDETVNLSESKVEESNDQTLKVEEIELTSDQTTPKADIKHEIKAEEEKDVKNVTKEEVVKQETTIDNNDDDDEIANPTPSTSTSAEPVLPMPEVDPDTPIGLDYVRQVVMFYCDLCHKYLPKLNRGDPDELVDDHCSSPGHQNAFIKKEAEKRLEEQEALKMLVKVMAQFSKGVVVY